MKSDVIHVTSDGAGFEDALAQAEAVAVYKSLPRKSALHLRLLTEEMMGMLRTITGEVEADFWIEDKRKSFTLHLVTDTFMNAEKRAQLLSVSSTGRNAAAKGVMGKIRDLFAQAYEPLDKNTSDYYSSGWLGRDMGIESSSVMVPHTWSFNRYRNSLDQYDPGNREEWDELEKSIVANLADEVEISIKDTYVEMVIYKKFA